VALEGTARRNTDGPDMTAVEHATTRRTASPHTAVDRRRANLIRRGRRLLRSTEELLDPNQLHAYEDADDLDVVAAQLDVLMAEVSDRLAAGRSDEDGPTMAQLGAALVDLQAFRSDVHDHEVHERLDRLEALDAGLAPLRYIHDPHELLGKACEAVVHCCGFDRALLSRVEDSIWRPWKSYAIHDRTPERAFREWMATTPEIPLDHLLLESEMVRRHGPALVTSPDDDPRVYRPMVEASGLKSYVAAPIMPTGRVIGFLHADYESKVVSELDRDILWAFAEAFGQIFERAVLLSRLRDQREQVRDAMETVERVLEDLATAEIELASRNMQRSAPPGRLPTGPSPAPGSRIHSLLTPRELEVLALMATGATNSRIAEQLVISDGTVKSHVKRILRKLRAANRGEAIARYLRLTMGSTPQR
jgi:LuxR family transcriptional regulator, regulator of acetate metabolism